MKNFAIRGRMFATLTVLGLSASTLLTGCFDKEHDDDANPSNSVCNTAATVVSTASGLALQLADGTTLTPSGTSWTGFQATAGEKVTIGYYTKKGHCGSTKSATPVAEIGCITAVAPTTTTTTGPN